jgi:hypothetical protein
MNRTIKLIVALMIITLAGFYARDYYFVIRAVDVSVVPATIFTGDSALITVRFLNSAGSKIPFAHRKVEFEIYQGGEHGTLEVVPENAKDPDAIFVHAISPGDVILHIHIAGFAFPYEKRVRISPSVA